MNPVSPEFVSPDCVVPQHSPDPTPEAKRILDLTAEASLWRRLYESVLSNTPDLGYVFTLDHRFAYANEALLKMWGRTWDDAIGKSCLELGYEPWHAAMHDREIEQVIATRQSVRGEVPFNGTNGRRIYDYIFFPVIGASGLVEAVAGTTRDITDIKRAQMLSECQRITLQSLTDGAPLNQILAGLVEAVERHGGDRMLCSILLLDESGTRFLPAIAPSLPKEYNDAIGGIEAASRIGTCCYSVMDGTSVSAPDVSADPKWARFAELIQPYGLNASWSTPIVGLGGKVLGTFANYYRQPCDPVPRDMDLVNFITQTAAVAIERKNADRDRLRDEDTLLEQKRLLELIVAGCTLQEYLTELTASVSRLLPDVRAAVVLADKNREKIIRVYSTDIPDSFAMGIHGAEISGSAVGTCARAMFNGEPVTSSDVAADERWSPEWRELCAAHQVLAAHSAPVFSSNGEVIASFFMAFHQAHQPTEWERSVGKLASHLAGIAIDRDRAATSLRESQERLSADLTDSLLLQSVGSEITSEKNPDRLYGKILDAAKSIMRSDFASIQMLHPERGRNGQLHLLAHRGFKPESAQFWEWVDADSQSTCGAALRSYRRVMVPDVTECAWMVSSADLATFCQSGIRAVQSTPLVSRNGRLLGMISTHWRNPHQPSERDFRMLDILARQAADLIEQSLAEERQKHAEEALLRAEKFAAAGRMAATIAHEINNPLEAVMNLWFLLDQENLSDVVRQRLETMGEELNRISHITRQTLEFYRHGNTARPVDIADPINAAISLFARRAETNRANITTIYKTPAKVYGFPGELRQLFANLIGNAIEAGSNTIKIRVSPGRLGNGSARPGIYVLVADNGAGIPDGAAAKVFEPFFTTKAEKGTGLGLWVSKGIVQKHEGWIRVRSGVNPHNRGTTFCMFLPTVADQQAAA